MSRFTVENDRAHFSRVWRSRHSQAVSMCVWPTTSTVIFFSSGGSSCSRNDTARAQESKNAGEAGSAVSTRSHAFAARFSSRFFSGSFSSRMS